MRPYNLAGLIVLLTSSPSWSQPAVSPSVPPSRVPQATTPEVIVPAAPVDRGAIVAPPVGASADPKVIVSPKATLGLAEADARRALIQAGYSDVMGLRQGSDGTWTGAARKGTASVAVAVDTKGNVTSR